MARFRLLVDATVPLRLHCGMRRPMEVELAPVKANARQDPSQPAHQTWSELLYLGQNRT